MKIRIVLAAAALAALAGCSSTSTSTPSTAAPAGGTSGTSGTAAAGPHRIVSLSPTATEDLFAIGAGAQVVAVDDQSNYPPQAPKTALSGYQPNVEAIAKYQPDLVVISDDAKNLSAQLGALHIAVDVEPAAQTLDDAYQQIDRLGDKTGHHDAAAKLATSMRDRITQLRKDVPPRSTPLTYYHEVDQTLYSETSKTFLGQVYALAGLQNIADAADTKGGGYPQLSAEYLIKANPQLVFLADTKCCQQSAATFAARPGYAALTAVREQHVYPLDDDIASRWGPRVVDLLQQVVGIVKGMPTT